MVNLVNVIQMPMQARKVRAAPLKDGVGTLLIIVHALDAQTSEKASLQCPNSILLSFDCH